MFEELLNKLLAFFTEERTVAMFKAAFILTVGLILARILSRAISPYFARRSQQAGMLSRRIVLYVITVLTIISALDQFDVNLTVLLSAAGILSVALGFACQTSASNIISGLFMIGERPFVIGDMIKIGEITGQIVAIDLLSIKLRTFDNLLVRVPNETIIKSIVTNMTHFPIRRIDLQLSVAYKENLERVREILMKLADEEILCLDEPVPLFIIQGFGDSGINIQFSIWAMRENLFAVRTGMQSKIKKAFDEHNIEIPFPHRTIYAGSATGPLQIQMVTTPSAPV